MEKTLPTNYKILHELWLNSGKSRVEISKNLDIDKSTVTLIINKLLKNGAVVEKKKADNSQKVGRHPILLKVDGSYGYVLGIAIQHHSYQIVVLDFSGNILLTEEKNELITYKNLKSLVEMIYWKYQEKLKNFPGRFLGIGIGVGGLIDNKSSTIVYSVPLEIYKPSRIINSIRNSIPIPVTIENDSNCCAMTELLSIKKQKNSLKNLIFVFIEFKHSLFPDLGHGRIGVGVGLVLNEKLYYGDNSFAGEFKSIFCENRDYFKQLSLKEYELDNLLQDDEVMQKTTSEISRNIAFLANILDISEIFIGGDIESVNTNICIELEKSIKENWQFPIERPLKISYSSNGPITVACGAAAKLTNELFQKKRLPI